MWLISQQDSSRKAGRYTDIIIERKSSSECFEKSALLKDCITFNVVSWGDQSANFRKYSMVPNEKGLAILIVFLYWTYF